MFLSKTISYIEFQWLFKQEFDIYVRYTLYFMCKLSSRDHQSGLASGIMQIRRIRGGQLSLQKTSKNYKSEASRFAYQNFRSWRSQTLRGMVEHSMHPLKFLVPYKFEIEAIVRAFFFRYFYWLENYGQRWTLQCYAIQCFMVWARKETIEDIGS